jgi:hypothetical protein
VNETELNDAGDPEILNAIVETELVLQRIGSRDRRSEQDLVPVEV